ncbi:hypothetical protein BH09PSE1_BH09PSE1_25210 [soil metagenome]
MTHPVLETIIDHLSRFRVRWAVAAGVAVTALALTAFAVGGRGGAEAETADGPRLNIAVVAPTEPDVQPGEVMDVGRLNDGFDGKMPERVEQTSADVDLYAEQPAYVEDDRRWRSDDRRPDDRYDDHPAYEDRKPDDRVEREAFRGRPMSFGFDQPQPDWRAEREARRAALDARERERSARREGRYSSSGGSLSQDSEFY